MLTISLIPAARARAITASRSSSNWWACRLTWLSISMGSSGAGGGAQVGKGGEQGVRPVEVQRLDLARQALERLPRRGPAIKAPFPAPRPLRGLVVHPHAQPLEQQRELRRPFGPAEAVGQGERRGLVELRQVGQD